MSSLLDKLKTALLIVVAGGVMYSVVTAIRAGADFSPGEKDLRVSKRLAKPLGAPEGTIDAKAPLPTGAAVIGGNGIIEPIDREIRLGAPVAGLVEKILVKEGDWVEEGAPVVKLADEVERAAFKAAEADVAAARAQLDRTKGALRFEDRRASYAEADSARSRAQLAKESYERLEKLYKQGAATQDERDKALRQYESDNSTARASDERARAARAGARRDDVQVSEAAIFQAEGRMLQAKATLERLTIRAPRAGQIIQVIVRPGEYYNPNVAGSNSTSWLLTMGDTRRTHVRIDVDERDYSKVRPGAGAFVTAEAFLDRRFPGKVIEIGRRMGRKNVRTDEPTERLDTKILEVVVALDQGKELVPGLRVMGYIELGGATSVTTATPAAKPSP